MTDGAPKVLLIEDESALALTLTDLLTSEGYRVETARDGHMGLELALTGEYHMVILDIMLPGKNGFDVCREIRQRRIQVPILMLTARGQVGDKVLGFKIGADDYVTKPFEPQELLVRMEALLRRVPSMPSAHQPEAFQFGAVVVDFRSTEVRRGGKRVEVSALEFELVRYFIYNQGVTISRDQLLQEVWGYDSTIVTRTVDVHIGLLRQKLEDDPKNPRHFLTVRGFGYKFVI